MSEGETAHKESWCAWQGLTGCTDSTGLTDYTMKTLNATRSTLNPCMLRLQNPKPLWRSSQQSREAVSQQAGEAGISTSAARSQPSTLVCCAPKPEASLEAISTRPRPVPIFRGSGISTGRRSRRINIRYAVSTFKPSTFLHCSRALPTDSADSTISSPFHLPPPGGRLSGSAGASLPKASSKKPSSASSGKSSNSSLAWA